MLFLKYAYIFRSLYGIIDVAWHIFKSLVLCHVSRWPPEGVHLRKYSHSDVWHIFKSLVLCHVSRWPPEGVHLRKYSHSDVWHIFKSLVLCHVSRWPPEGVHLRSIIQEGHYEKNNRSNLYWKGTGRSPTSCHQSYAAGLRLISIIDDQIIGEVEKDRKLLLLRFINV